MTLYDLATPLLYRMDPERAHSLGVFFMRFLRDKNVDYPSVHVKTPFGEIRNPIGLAAGFDKTGKHLSTLQKLGFGYIVAGTITEDHWPGHPKPRIVRNVKEKTLVNGLGFPNPGADGFIENLKRQKLKIPIVASVSGKTESSILECYEKIQPHVAAIELNLSSPNTQNLKDLRELDSFRPLANKMGSIKKRPTFLKVPPFYDEAQSERNLEMIKSWSEFGFEGVTASNSMPVKEPRLSIGSGGFSGPPLFKYTLSAIREIRKIVPSGFEINSVGGISTSNDIMQAMEAGASTVQLMTSLVYGGPGLIKGLLEGIANREKTSVTVAKAV
ncbi:MAG: dihydroorotate dehydrogenase [Nitrososphaerales archaeon]